MERNKNIEKIFKWRKETVCEYKLSFSSSFSFSFFFWSLVRFGAVQCWSSEDKKQAFSLKLIIHIVTLKNHLALSANILHVHALWPGSFTSWDISYEMLVWLPWIYAQKWVSILLEWKLVVMETAIHWDKFEEVFVIWQWLGSWKRWS